MSTPGRDNVSSITTSTTQPSISRLDPPSQTAGELAEPGHRRNRRRRRRDTTSEQTDTEEARRTNIGLGDERSERGIRDGEQPSSKRRRLGDSNMRPDGGASTSNANGLSSVSNGTSSSPLRKSTVSGSLGGRSPHSDSQGQSQANGSSISSSAPTYYGHNREEVTRILIQSLYDMGYNEAATTLTRESKYELESPGVASFRTAVLDGHWAEAEKILANSLRSEDGMINSQLHTPEGLILAEDANENEMLFCLRQQKFLELLERRDLPAALMVLRQELTPLNHDTAQLHSLSSLLMCPPESLRAQAGCERSVVESRERLLSELSRSISPCVMIPDHRLAVLLDHVKQSQINQCLYHNTAESPSLYADHVCYRSQFPLHSAFELSQNDEVWYVEFSHDGTKLATTSRDHSVVIYDAVTFEVIHQLIDHTQPVAYATWSPDDSKLISCSQDYKAKLWDVKTGRCILTINHHNEPVTSAAWAPDGETFVTSSLDSQSPLCHWSVKGKQLHIWPGPYRARDCAISPDGERLVAISPEKRIYVYNFATYMEEYSLLLKLDLTCINISRDSRYMLVSMSDSEVQLLDIETTDVVRRFLGQKQGTFMIRSNFGGAAENFVVSGSEDSKIYIWYKENSVLVETLEGHVSGCVNAIAWNSTNPGMFASAGDDRKVRIWTRDPSLSANFGAKSRNSLRNTTRTGNLMSVKAPPPS